MRYITHYEEYPIYEPAEGGYYYSGNKVVSSERMSKRQAKRNLLKLYKEAETEEYEQWVMSRDGNMIYKRNKYIGEGESYVVERKKGSMKKGYMPYC